MRPTLHKSLAEAGFEKPTPIQAGTIEHALEGKDIIGLAQTGTGKTAAFAIPIIHSLANTPDLGALVLAPTRELAAQITDVFNKLGHNCGIRVATIIGGVPMENDDKALRSWPNVIVATPGRLIDHIDNGNVFFKEIKIFAVDEADRMHDMGFIPQIRRIISVLPKTKQTLMFTATMPKDVEQVVCRAMHNPIHIKIGNCVPAQRAKQELFELGETEKGKLLLKLLKESTGRTLIFVKTKRGVDRVARAINARGFGALPFHGDMEHSCREKALAKFTEGTSRILVATDIAARGLDVSNIEHVINYDFPHQAEDYVHRIGRTARVDASGLATSFIVPTDYKFVKAVARLVGDKFPIPTRLESYKNEPKTKQKPNTRRRRRSYSPK